MLIVASPWCARPPRLIVSTIVGPLIHDRSPHHPAQKSPDRQVDRIGVVPGRDYEIRPFLGDSLEMLRPFLEFQGEGWLYNGHCNEFWTLYDRAAMIWLTTRTNLFKCLL